MSDFLEPELMRFESEMSKLKAAPVPEELKSRLLALRPQRQPSVVPSIESASGPLAWRQFLRWLIPAAAMGIVALVVALQWHPTETLRNRVPGNLATSAPNQGSVSGVVPKQAREPEELEIGQTWVTTFDAVAELPTGEPVRFRCREWTDTTVFRDRARGLIVERSTPRLEVVPISFETY